MSVQAPVPAERLVAHRGYQRHYPENSPLAIEQAIACGARYVEIDVQMSADAVPLLYHDADLHRISGQHGQLTQFHWRALQELTAGEPGRFGTRFADVRIAPLQALVDILRRHPHVQALVELKEEAVRDHGATRCLDTLHAVLAPVLSRCILISFDLAALRQARQHGFRRLGPIVRDWAARLEVIAELEAEMLICNYKRVPARGSLALDHCGLALYEIDDRNLAHQLLARGASWVETFAIGELLRLHD